MLTHYVRQHKSVCQRQCQIQHVGVGSPIALDFDELRGNPALKSKGSTHTTEAVTREIMWVKRHQRGQVFDAIVQGCCGDAGVLMSSGGVSGEWVASRG